MTPPRDRDLERAELDVDDLDVDARGFLLGPRELMSDPRYQSTPRRPGQSRPSDAEYGGAGERRWQQWSEPGRAQRSRWALDAGYKGPTDRKDVVIAVAAVALVVGGIVALALG